MLTLRERAKAFWKRIRHGRLAELIETIFALWSQHAVPRHAAALAFYTLLALAPMLLALTGIGGYWLGRQRASKQLIKWVERTVGSAAAQPISHLIEQTVPHGSGASVTLIGLMLALWGASGLLQTAKASLDEFWEAPSPNTPLKGWLLNRLAAAGGVLLLAMLLNGSIVLEVVLQALRQHANELPLVYPLLVWFSRGLLPVLTSVGFALLYWLLPSVKPRWRDALLSACFTVALLMGARALVSLYIARSGLATLYGSAGALVVLLLWVYVSAMIFFLGALLGVALSRGRR